MLRKEGYIKTQRTPSNKRVYNISFENKQGGKSYYDIINRYAPNELRVKSSEIYKIYGRDISLEESFIFALKSRKIRLVLASLSLFTKITNWFLLYRLAKANNLIRETGALYDLSRMIMRIRHMDGRVQKLMLTSKENKRKYIINGYKTKDKTIKEIENCWKIYIPFNKEDLENYRSD